MSAQEKAIDWLFTDEAIEVAARSIVGFYGASYSRPFGMAVVSDLRREVRRLLDAEATA